MRHGCQHPGSRTSPTTPTRTWARHRGPARLLLAFGLLVAWSATAITPAAAGANDAPPTLISPAPGAVLVAGSPVHFTMSSTSGEPRLQVQVSRSPQLQYRCGTSGGGFIGGEVTTLAASVGPDAFTYVADAAPFPYSAPWTSTPGTYYWQAYRPYRCEASAPRSFTIVPRQAVAAPVATAAVDPAAGLVRDRISSSIGVRRTYSYVLDLGLMPAGVSRQRFGAIVKNSAARWGMVRTGLSYDGVKFGDGRSEVGFGVVPGGELGVTRRQIKPRYRHAPYSCRLTANGGAWCAHGSARMALEIDVRINFRATWQQGPAKPTSNQYDLETAVLHELGHFVGNGHRADGCTETLMMAALSTGDWWHSSYDWHRAACASGGRSGETSTRFD